MLFKNWFQLWGGLRVYYRLTEMYLRTKNAKVNISIFSDSLPRHWDDTGEHLYGVLHTSGSVLRRCAARVTWRRQGQGRDPTSDWAAWVVASIQFPGSLQKAADRSVRWPTPKTQPYLSDGGESDVIGGYLRTQLAMSLFRDVSRQNERSADLLSRLRMKILFTNKFNNQINVYVKTGSLKRRVLMGGRRNSGATWYGTGRVVVTHLTLVIYFHSVIRLCRILKLYRSF